MADEDEMTWREKKFYKDAAEDARNEPDESKPETKSMHPVVNALLWLAGCVGIFALLVLLVMLISKYGL